VKLGIISGSGSHTWPGLLDPCEQVVTTGHGDVEVTLGRLGSRDAGVEVEIEVVHVSRHGPGHARLPHQVTHRANLAALLASEVDAVVSLTVCGAVDEGIPLGSLVVFDDLHFPLNRLPDGSACTWYAEPADPRRGHWIAAFPFCQPLRAALVAAGTAEGLPVVDGGCYGHVEGPRFNTRSEVRQLTALGVAAVSQTAGPEVVLAGEAELPLALVGYLTDRANGVGAPEPVEALLARMAASPAAFAALVARSVPELRGLDLAAPGVVYRFQP